MTSSRTPRSRRAADRAALVLVLLALLGTTTATIVATAAPAAACSCAGLGDEEALAQADVVFVGEVRETDLPASGWSDATTTVWFDVSEVYEGQAFADQPVGTAQSSVSCGLELRRLDGPTLVFAHRVHGDDLESQRLEAGLCDGTRAVSQGGIPAGWTATATVAGQGSTTGGSGSWVAPVAIAASLIAVMLVGGVLVVRARRST